MDVALELSKTTTLLLAFKPTQVASMISSAAIVGNFYDCQVNFGDPYPISTLTPSAPFPHQHPSPISTLTPSAPFPHQHPYPISTLTPSAPLPHQHPSPISTLTPSAPIPHQQPYPISTLTPSAPLPHQHPYPISTLTPSAPIPHQHPYPISTLTPSAPLPEGENHGTGVVLFVPPEVRNGKHMPPPRSHTRCVGSQPCNRSGHPCATRRAKGAHNQLHSLGGKSFTKTCHQISIASLKCTSTRMKMQGGALHVSHSALNNQIQHCNSHSVGIREPCIYVGSVCALVFCTTTCTAIWA
jgi:hypothetical protein